MPKEPSIPNLRQYVKDLGVSFKETPNSFVFTCPLCKKEERLYIRKEDGKWRCFYCISIKGYGGKDPERALADISGRPLEDVKAELYDNGVGISGKLFPGMKLDEGDFEIEDEAAPQEEPLNEVFFPFYFQSIHAEGSKPGREYLLGRGITAEIADLYGIKYSAKDRAVVFPVWQNEKLYGWQYRIIDPEVVERGDEIFTRRKAWSSTDLPSAKTLMFHSRLRNAQRAIMCEGPIDAIKCHLLGPGNIATMGKAVSRRQMELILESGVKDIYLGQDPDAWQVLKPLISQCGVDLNFYQVKVPEIRGKKADLGALPMQDVPKIVLMSPKVNRCSMFAWFKPID